MNVPNIKEGDYSGYKITKQGAIYFKDHFEKREDPHGRQYYWMTGVIENPDNDIQWDGYAIKKKYFLGVNKFNHLAINKKISFIALGGINETNIKKINLLNCYGFAGIRWIKKNGPRKLGPFLNCLNSY